MVKKIFDWIWISILLLTAIFFIILLTENEFKTNLIGGGLLIILAIRRILLLYGKTGTGNKNVYFLIFLLGFSLPIVYEYGLTDKENQVKILMLYFLLYGSLVSWMAKKGMLGKKMQASIKKADEKAKQQREKEKAKKEKWKKEQENKKTIETVKKEQKQQEQTLRDKEKKINCMYCGQEYGSISTLTLNKCTHGQQKGQKHVLYEGSEKEIYFCKHCGVNYNSISTMTLNKCGTGNNKGGYHVPAL